MPDYDAKLEALVPVVAGELPAHFHAHRADDIATAVRLSREFGLKLVVVHGTEGYLVPELLAEAGVPVITGPCLTDRSKPELVNMTIETPAILRMFGVKTAVCTDHPETPIQYLPLCAAMAIRGGMDPEGALACITINAAQLAGIDDRVGSLTPGKDADVVVTSAQNRELAVSERTKEQIRQRLEIATMLNSCVGKLNSDTDIDVGINNLLATVNDYFQADRTYVFEIDPDRDVLINTFEYICGQEVSAQMDNLQEVPVSVIEVWMQNFRQGRSYYMSDLEQERGQPSYEMLKAQQVWRLLAVPLMKGGAVVGFLGVDNPRAHYDDATLLASIQFFVTNSLDRKKQQAYLEKLSYRDMLTGLYNRNRYIERLEAYKQVQDQQIGAIYIDLNGLKKVNDEQGHRAGDELIVRAAGTIAGIFAEDAYRVGGDEFVVILLDVSREEFARKTEQLRRQMQENSVDASIGGVWQASTENLEDLLRRADENMYREKKRYYSKVDAARKPES